MKKERHGMADTPTYRSWEEMRGRCQRPTHSKFPEYGGRGIAVCARWQSFTAFLSDMGPRPPNTTLDRVDVNGNYSPGNCRWATPEQQAFNQRLRKSNKTGIKGVFFRRGSYEVNVRQNKKQVHLGRTPDFFEACCVRKSAEIKFYQPAHRKEPTQ